MRLFLAVEPTPEARRRWVALQASLRAVLRGWRWIAPESLHLTLRFLGTVESALDGRSREQWRSAARATPPFALRMTEVGHFPARGGPRVLWLGLGEVSRGGSLVALAGALEREARALGFPPEARPFRAHVTLARAERGGDPPRPPERVELTDEEAFQVREIVLFESRLQPTGASYAALEHFPFGARPAPG